MIHQCPHCGTQFELRVQEELPLSSSVVRSVGNLQLNWTRKGRVPISGIYVRAQHGKEWINCDVTELTGSSFLQFLRSLDRDGTEHVAVAIQECLPLRGGL